MVGTICGSVWVAVTHGVVFGYKSPWVILVWPAGGVPVSNLMVRLLLCLGGEPSIGFGNCEGTTRANGLWHNLHVAAREVENGKRKA
jgi:hypothetical protein